VAGCLTGLDGWLTPTQVRSVGAGHSLSKVVLSEGGSWESARPPFEVTLHVTLRTLAYDGIPQTGHVLYSTTSGSSSSTGSGGAPITCVMGQGSLPAGMEEALGHMCRGEHSLFIIPAAEMQPPSGSSTGAAAGSKPPAAAGSNGSHAHTGPAAAAAAAGSCLLPPPPATAMQVEAEIELAGLVQVSCCTLATPHGSRPCAPAVWTPTHARACSQLSLHTQR
jgi:hypothetical protein